MLIKKLLILLCVMQIYNSMAMELSLQEKIENYRKRIEIGQDEKLGSTNPYQLSFLLNGRNSIFDALLPNDQDVAKIIWQSKVYCTNIIKGTEVKFSYALDVESIKQILQPKTPPAQTKWLQNPLFTFSLGALFAGLILKLPTIIPSISYRN